ncbi:hypothetical protein DB346_17530 [Verrucomicrobia bacterium LW23]|nr:hypothetical protein DB346_17530 [Verrucomicrobia bacterium LW23]
MSVAVKSAAPPPATPAPEPAAGASASAAPTRYFPVIAIVVLFPLLFFSVLYYAISTATHLVERSAFYGPDQTKIDNAPGHAFGFKSHFTQYADIQADATKREALEKELKQALPAKVCGRLYYVASFTTSAGEPEKLYMPLLMRAYNIDPGALTAFFIINLHNYSTLHFTPVDGQGLRFKCEYPFAEDLGLPRDTTMTVVLTPVFPEAAAEEAKARAAAEARAKAGTK